MKEQLPKLVQNCFHLGTEEQLPELVLKCFHLATEEQLPELVLVLFLLRAKEHLPEILLLNLQQMRSPMYFHPATKEPFSEQQIQ
jgi:hypothetical protein